MVPSKQKITTSGMTTQWREDLEGRRKSRGRVVGQGGDGGRQEQKGGSEGDVEGEEEIDEEEGEEQEEDNMEMDIEDSNFLASQQLQGIAMQTSDMMERMLKEIVEASTTHRHQTRQSLSRSYLSTIEKITQTRLEPFLRLKQEEDEEWKKGAVCRLRELVEKREELEDRIVEVLRKWEEEMKGYFEGLMGQGQGEGKGKGKGKENGKGKGKGKESELAGLERLEEWARAIGEGEGNENGK